MPDSFKSGIYVEEAARMTSIAAVPTATAGFVGVTAKSGFHGSCSDTPTCIENWEQFVEIFGRYTGSAPHMAPAVYSFFVNGGKRCYILSVADESDESLIGTEHNGTSSGLQAFNALREIQIVVIPGATSQRVQQALIDHCETLGDRICILDSRRGDDLQGVIEQRSKLVSEKGYGALYYPWIRMEIEKEGSDGTLVIKETVIPPSGAIAGIYARIDAERGVYKAPVNAAISHALALETNLSKTGQDTLRQNGINAIRSYVGRGIVIWGGQTLSTQAEWKPLHIRRLMICLEQSISRWLQWAAFETNGPELWGRVTLGVEDFLTRLWREGGLQGEKRDEAFFVTCDPTTMNRNDIEEGRLNLVVGIAPVKPAEYTVFKITQRIQPKGN